MPRILPTVDEPRTRDEVLAELAKLHHASGSYWSSFSTLEFLAPIGSGWSPADTVRHLSKAIWPVAQGLRAPRFVHALLFGRPRRPSRSYAEIRDAYRARLERGLDAGRFAPRPQPPPADGEGFRAGVMERHERVAATLAASLRRWPEEALDRYRMPHPVLGKLTARELLLFTLYHNLHHVLVVERRLAEHRAAVQPEAPAASTSP